MILCGVLLSDSCQQQEDVCVVVKPSKTWQFMGILFLPLIRVKLTLFMRGVRSIPPPPQPCPAIRFKTGTQIPSASGTRQKKIGFSVEIFGKSRGGCWLSFQFAQMANKKKKILGVYFAYGLPSGYLRKVQFCYHNSIYYGKGVCISLQKNFSANQAPKPVQYCFAISWREPENMGSFHFPLWLHPQLGFIDSAPRGRMKCILCKKKSPREQCSLLGLGTQKMWSCKWVRVKAERKPAMWSLYSLS